MAAPSSTSADRLARRLLQLAALLSLLLIAVVVNAFAHSDEDPLNPVAAAAERTQQLPGVRMQMEATYGLPSGSMQLEGTGAFNTETDRGQMAMTMNVPTKGSFQMDVVSDGSSVYLRSNLFAGKLPPGKEWVGGQVEVPFSGDGDTPPGGESAQESLEMLRAVSDDFTDLGPAQLDGAATTRYRGSIDLGRFAALLRDHGQEDLAQTYEKVAEATPTPIDFEVWIAADGLVRQISENLSISPTPGQPPISIAMRIDLTKLTTAPNIELPDPSEVLDTSALTEALSNPS